MNGCQGVLDFADCLGDRQQMSNTALALSIERGLR